MQPFQSIGVFVRTPFPADLQGQVFHGSFIRFTHNESHDSVLFGQVTRPNHSLKEDSPTIFMIPWWTLARSFAISSFDKASVLARCRLASISAICLMSLYATKWFCSMRSLNFSSGTRSTTVSFVARIEAERHPAQQFHRSKNGVQGYLLYFHYCSFV